MTTNPATATPAQQYQSYTDRLLNASTPPLGMVAWYYVPSGAKIKIDDFSNLIDQYNAPIEKKKKPVPANVFRRACKHVEMKKQQGPDPETRCNYRVDDAGPDTEFVFKSIVEQQVDSKEHELDHRVLGKITFHKSTGKMEFDDKIDQTDPAWPLYVQMKSSIRRFSYNEAEMLHDLPIRESARRAVEFGLNGVRVRPGGGVYFVSNDHAEGLEAVNSVINAVDGASFHMLPLPDDPEQRTMLRTEFNNEVLESCGYLMDDLTSVLGAGKVTHKKAEELLARYESVSGKIDEFSSLLNDTLDDAREHAKLVKRQVNQMVKMIGGE